jgi:hypothetical protein
MTPTPMAPNVCHHSILWPLQDVGRVAPMHRAHPPPIVASPLEGPLPKPWESCVSNKTGCPAHFEALSLHILPLSHPPDSSADVVGIHPAVADLHVHNKEFFLKYLILFKNICVFFTLFKKQKKMKYF